MAQFYAESGAGGALVLGVAIHEKHIHKSYFGKLLKEFLDILQE